MRRAFAPTWLTGSEISAACTGRNEAEKLNIIVDEEADDRKREVDLRIVDKKEYFLEASALLFGDELVREKDPSRGVCPSVRGALPHRVRRTLAHVLVLLDAGEGEQKLHERTLAGPAERERYVVPLGETGHLGLRPALLPDHLQRERSKKD